MNFPKKFTNETIYIGSMSGTSVDKKVDFTAAIFSNEGKLLYHENLVVELPENTRRLLYKLSTTPCDQLTVSERNDGEIAITDFLIEAFQSVIQQWGLASYSNIVLSPHGQTIDHKPLFKTTHQLVHGERLAYETSYPVVFRHRQSCIPFSNAAPLAPLLLESLFDDNCILINGGGIANLAILEKGKEVIAFDSGPANGPLDELVQHIIKTEPSAIPADLAEDIIKEGFDVSGDWAKRGNVCEAMTETLLTHSYFADKTGKKSADRTQFDLTWALDAKGNATWSDTVTTLSYVIASSLSQAIRDQVSVGEVSIGLYGGLRYNTYIIDTFLEQLSDFSITLIDWKEKSLDPDFIESLLMAYLGFCVHQDKTISLQYCSVSNESKKIIPGLLVTP